MKTATKTHGDMPIEQERCDYWFKMWYEDKISMIATMNKNMVSDLEHGYDPNGKCIRGQLDNIYTYQTAFYNQLDTFINWSDYKIERWCYYDLLKRGVIT